MRHCCLPGVAQVVASSRTTKRERQEDASGKGGVSKDVDKGRGGSVSEGGVAGAGGEDEQQQQGGGEQEGAEGREGGVGSSEAEDLAAAKRKRKEGQDGGEGMDIDEQE